MSRPYEFTEFTESPETHYWRFSKQIMPSAHITWNKIKQNKWFLQHSFFSFRMWVRPHIWNKINVRVASGNCPSCKPSVYDIRDFVLLGFTVLARVHCWLGSRVVSVLDSGAEGPGFKSQSRRCRVTVLSKLFTPIVPLFTKQQNW